MIQPEKRRVKPHTTGQLKIQRQRGVVLTPSGLRRLQAVIQKVEIAENNGTRFTLEDLGDRINLSTKTLSRLWSLNSGVDQKTLKLCFSAFNLELHPDDYTTLSKLEASDTSQSASSAPHTELRSIVADWKAGEAGGEKVSSLNATLYQTNSQQSITEQPINELHLKLSYPDGPVALNSPFYIERPPIEALAYREITQPGCVIRIRAPKEMGKSSLMLRLLAFAETQRYRTVMLDCNQFDSSGLGDFNKFLRGFCLRVTRELGIAPNLDNYWDDDIGSKLSCSFYFKNYLLEVIDSPVVLVFNEVDRLFEYPQLAQEFFPLLRSWYEEARRDVNLQKLRLVVVYSTEEYVALDINRSPFNIGLPLHLPEFTQLQVQDLAQRHGLNWSCDKEVTALMELVGGHPALIRIALYYICTQGLSLHQLLQDAIANGGIFQNHLWRHWITLQKKPDLAEAMATIVSAQHCIFLNPIQVYKLESQGLIRHEDECIKPRCELYRTYFQQQLSASRR